MSSTQHNNYGVGNIYSPTLMKKLYYTGVGVRDFDTPQALKKLNNTFDISKRRVSIKPIKDPLKISEKNLCFY